MDPRRTLVRIKAASIWWLALAVGITLAVLAVSKAPRVLAPLDPLELEQAIGEAVLAGFHHVGAVCSGEEGQRAVNRLGERLAATLETPFTIQVVDVPEINAFAAPGGYVVLFSGLLDFAVNADETAGVLAHEMAHVAHRHPTEQVLRAMGVAALFQVLIGDSSMMRAAIAEIGVSLVRSGYSRHAEVEADVTAVSILNRAGVRASGLASLLERLYRTRARSRETPVFLSTHPSNKARSEELMRQATFGGEPALSAMEWREVKAICA